MIKDKIYVDNKWIKLYKKNKLTQRFELWLEDLESHVLPLHHTSFVEYLVLSDSYKRQALSQNFTKLTKKQLKSHLIDHLRPISNLICSSTFVVCLMEQAYLYQV